MKNIKVKFMKRHPFAIALFIMETISCGIIFVISIIDMKLIISLICMLITAFMYFICFISDIYGIKIKNNYIIFRVDGERRKYLIEDVKNVEVRFIKKKKYYKVYMRVHFVNSYSKKEFIWDEINIRRCGFVKTKINDDNIIEYVSLFKSLDKFYVYRIK